MKQNNVSVFTKIYSAAIILLPFLYQYSSPLSFLSMGDFIITILTCFGLFKIDLSCACKYTKPLIVFSFAFIGLSVFVSFFSSEYFKYNDALTIFLKILLYLCVCAVCTRYFDLQFIKSFYLILVFLFAFYLVIQVIFNKISGKYLPIYLKHSWLFSWEKRPQNLADYYGINGYMRFRPSSLFLEPGYYALFVLPALFLLLFGSRKIFLSILLYFTIVLSTSGAGIIIGFFAFILKGLNFAVYLKKGKIYFTRYALAAVLILFAVILYLILNPEILSKIFNSFNSRISRSLLIFQDIDTSHKLFGVGMNNTENYVKFYGIYTAYDEGNLNFGASLVASLVQYGILGFLIFLCSLVTLLLNSKASKIGMLFAFLYIIYTIFEEVIFNFRMAFLLSFAIYYIRNTQRFKYGNVNKINSFLGEKTAI